MTHDTILRRLHPLTSASALPLSQHWQSLRQCQLFLVVALFPTPQKVLDSGLDMGPKAM